MHHQEVINKLKKHCPIGFQINEIIPFGYPFRRIKVRVIVVQSPDKTVQKIYSVLLRTINSGLDTIPQMSSFLGLSEDDFLFRELYALREQELVDLKNDKWWVTEKGHLFIADHTSLKVLEEVDFEFLMDGITNQLLPYTQKLESNTTFKKLSFDNQPKHKAENLLKDKEEAIRDLHSKCHREATLIDILPHKITFDKWEYSDNCLIEYIPMESRKDELEPFIQIRDPKDEYRLDRLLTEQLASQYPNIVYQLTDSERPNLVDLESPVQTQMISQPKIMEGKMQTLTIWETQRWFEKALRDTQKEILIESPWIKRATAEYILAFKQLLKQKKKLTILYGIEEKDEHHTPTLDKLKELQKQFKNQFFLIHLPTHFEDKAMRLTGTHRKLLIKDNDYYISGSFNFLSFNKKEGDKVANEESVLIRTGVEKKWEMLKKEYRL